MTGEADEEQSVTADEQSEFEQTVQWLQRATGDPMADAVPGRVRVDAVSDAAARGRYQQCRVEVTAHADGIPPTASVIEIVIDTRHWPRVGQVLPARISPSDPRVLEVNWDALRR